MPTMTDDSAQRLHIEERFRAQVSWREGTVDGAPAWYEQLLSDLVLATGEDRIRYFSAEYTPARDDVGVAMTVVAFTDDIVAYVVLDGEPDGPYPLEVVVTARRALDSFSLETGASGGSGDAVRITVNYPNFSRALPLGESDWADRESETAQLIRRLRQDLVA